MTPEKKCAKCGDVKTGTHSSYCRSCYNAYKRDRYKRNRASEVARSAAYNKANPEKHRKHSRDWYKRNNGEVDRAYKKANPDKYQVANQRKRVREAGLLTDGEAGLTEEQWLAIKAEHANACAYCGSTEKLTIDHVVPLCQGGPHDASNIVPACATCNAKKATRTPTQWSESQEGAPMKSESVIQSEIRVALSRAGARVLRNQVGQYRLEDGRTIRSGLCNGSSDLIGWQPVQITPEMVGQRLAVFVACEVKRPGRQPTKQQADFLAAVKRAGGVAMVATSAEEAVGGLLR